MLQDRFGRTIQYLRLSVTDRCDLRCSYCLPRHFKGYEEPAHWLSFAEIERVARIFAHLGVSRVRLTGGEPLLRRDLPVLVANLAALPGVEDLSLSTNATQLNKYAGVLREAGLQRLNISLDSLKRDCVNTITGRDSFDRIMQGLMAGKAAGFQPIKINMVALKGVNEDEIEDMAAFCLAHDFILRVIEAMPMGETGQNAAFLSIDKVREQLVRAFDLIPQSDELGGGPARYWQPRTGRGAIGFITPLSQHFCASCNRVRLSVDGTLYLCLGQEEKFALRPLLRGGASDEEIAAAIRQAIELKPERHEFHEAKTKIIRVMAQTGG